MKPLDRDTHILEHIVSYCQQIEETVARFGNDGSIFSSDPIYRNAAALCILQRRFEYFSKGSVSKLSHAKSQKPTLLRYIIRCATRVCPIGTRFWFIQVGSADFR